MLPLFWRAKIRLDTFSRPILDEVHFLRLCCNPASPSEKHVTESRACKTLLRKQVFPWSEIPFASILPWVVFRINEEIVLSQRQKIRIWTERSEIRGAFHSTKNSGFNYRNVRMSNGTVFSIWLTLSRSIPTRAHFTPRFKMADLRSLFLAFELQDDFHLLGDMLEDSDEEIAWSAACCFMRGNLNRIQDYFEQTLPRYLPHECKYHLRMMRQTCELLSREIIQTGQIPIRNSSRRPVIAPKKQILAFLWRITSREPARAVEKTIPYRLTWRNTRNIEGLATPPPLPLVEATGTARETRNESCREEMSNGMENFRNFQIFGKKDNV